jgi:hypothetical protein
MEDMLKMYGNLDEQVISVLPRVLQEPEIEKPTRRKSVFIELR